MPWTGEAKRKDDGGTSVFTPNKDRRAWSPLTSSTVVVSK
jgi:hypothetical protein